MRQSILRSIILLGIFGLYITCIKHPLDNRQSTGGFNGFPWGTSMETIVSKLGIQPDEKLTDRIRYNKQHAIYEGITGERISYVAPGNKLASGTFVRFKNPKSAYDSLFRIFTARHGKPIKNSEGVPVWRTPGTDIVLSLSKDLMMASAAPKLPK